MVEPESNNSSLIIYFTVSRKMDSDSDVEKRNLDADLPPYRIRHSDMNLKLVKDVIRRKDVCDI